LGNWGTRLVVALADSPVPYFVGNFIGVTAFAVGGDQSCAIVAGQIYCWGDNQYGQIASEPVGIGEFRTTPTPIAGAAAIERSGRCPTRLCLAQKWHGHVLGTEQPTPAGV
jgi:hypothetical protein